MMAMCNYSNVTSYKKTYYVRSVIHNIESDTDVIMHTGTTRATPSMHWEESHFTLIHGNEMMAMMVLEHYKD